MNIFKKVTNFLKEVKLELNKVSWSTRQELVSSTVVVITVTFIMAVFIGVIDFLLSGVLRVVFK
ncbi:MAG: preprotein translocase subunit SecE [Candidatus Omnitrophica bacterium CG23_combo_of_CG06-09_8_20_14_all_40_11]|nr:MAG: preprotein translocase subunit SecE [Candidatus Omnitrophica bacterium CG23_combo_of_CG06-09_8_20_14_all_40_11]